jgi:hypothetical protein
VRKKASTLAGPGWRRHPYLDNRKPLHDQRPCSIPVAPAAARYLVKVQRFGSRKLAHYQSLISSVLNPQSPEVWRKTAGEKEFWVSAGASQSGGLRAKARVYWDICPLERRQRILDEDALAEGEKLDSNILSQHCEALRVGSLRSRSAATHPIGILRPVVMGMPCWSEAR